MEAAEKSLLSTEAEEGSTEPGAEAAATAMGLGFRGAGKFSSMRGGG